MRSDLELAGAVTLRARARPLLGAILLASSVVACKSEPVRRDDVTDAFYERGIRTICALPPTNLTTSPEATDVVHRYVVGYLKRRGYAVDAPSDATLYVTIESWFRDLDVSRGGSRRCVQISAKLYARGSGELLWSNQESLADEPDDEDDDEDRPDGWIEAVSGSLADWVVATITDPLMDGAEDLAKECVAETIATLPPAGAKRP